jgi:hypothetical protein
MGAVAIGDIAVLEHRRGVIGSVASPATVWRTLDETGELRQRRIARAPGPVEAGVPARQPKRSLARPRPPGETNATSRALAHATVAVNDWGWRGWTAE